MWEPKLGKDNMKKKISRPMFMEHGHRIPSKKIQHVHSGSMRKDYLTAPPLSGEEPEKVGPRMRIG